MNNHDRQLWQQLHDGGLVKGELPVALHQQPLYLRLFFGGMIWLAAQSFLFSVLGFFGLFLFMLRSDMEAPLAVGGIVLLGLAAWLTRQRRHPFIDQLGAAAALTGQGMLILLLVVTDQLGHGALALIQLPVFFLVRNSLIRSLAVAAFVLTGCYELGQAVPAINAWLLPVVLLVASWLYHTELLRAAQQQWLHPLKRGLTLALWIWLLLQHSAHSTPYLDEIWQHTPLLLTLAGAGWLLWFVATQLRQTAQRVAGLLLGALVLLAGWLIPGVTVLGLLLTLAWRHGQFHYAIAHLLALVAALMAYYYNLEQSLLFKAYVLLGLSVVLLVVRLAVLRLLSPAAAGEN